jgi:Zn-dependent protease
LALSLFVLGTGITHVANAASWIVACVAILVIHELGHQIMAEWRGSKVLAINIYPFHGSCVHEAPRSSFDKALIAFGGAGAQLVVAAPFALFIKFVGSTGVGALDILLAALGVVSPVVAIFNLLPIAPLDGHAIWVSIRHSRRAVRLRQTPKCRTVMEAMEEALRKGSKSRGA